MCTGLKDGVSCVIPNPFPVDPALQTQPLSCARAVLVPTEAHWFDTQCQVQDRHAVASSCGEYVPVEHCGQPYKLELATVGLYLPDGQDVHVAEPVVDLYVPVGVTTHPTCVSAKPRHKPSRVECVGHKYKSSARVRPGWHEVQLGTSPLMTVDVAELGIP